VSAACSAYRLAVTMSGRVVVQAPVAPMAAVRVTTLPTSAGWVFEPKFDGFLN
jgi:ATP-dependent DNA ligase